MNPLRDALASAAGATEADRTLEVAQSEVKGLTREATVRHGRLPGAPKDIDATMNLAVPSKATIRRIRDEMEEIQRGIKAEQGKILEGKKRIENIQAELGRMARRGKLPSEEALRDARLHRDHGWALVLAEWKGDGAKEEFISGVPLEEAFPQSMVKADEIADDLQKQAEAVAQAEEKRFQISKSETQNAEAATKSAELQSALTACQASWEEAWKLSGVTPRTPDEMEEWRESWSEFREVLGKLRTAEEALQQKQQRVQQATQQLAAVLGESDTKGFSLLFEAARKRVQAGEKAMGRREEVANQAHELTRQLETVDQDRAHVAQSFKKATNDWITQCKAVGLRDGISPQSGLALLQERKELLSILIPGRNCPPKQRRFPSRCANMERRSAGKPPRWASKAIRPKLRKPGSGKRSLPRATPNPVTTNWPSRSILRTASWRTGNRPPFKRLKHWTN